MKMFEGLAMTNWNLISRKVLPFVVVGIVSCFLVWVKVTFLDGPKVTQLPSTPDSSVPIDQNNSGKVEPADSQSRQGTPKSPTPEVNTPETSSPLDQQPRGLASEPPGRLPLGNRDPDSQRQLLQQDRFAQQRSASGPVSSLDQVDSLGRSLNIQNPHRGTGRSDRLAANNNQFQSNPFPRTDAKPFTSDRLPNQSELLQTVPFNNGQRPGNGMGQSGFDVQVAGGFNQDGFGSNAPSRVAQAPVAEAPVVPETELSPSEESVVRNHLDLAGRYARKDMFLSAEEESVKALEVIAKIRRRSNRNPNSMGHLDKALVAYRELEELTLKVEHGRADLAGVVNGHQTPVEQILGHPPENYDVVREAYLNFAEENLFKATGRNPFVSETLYTLGKVHLVQMNRKTENPGAHFILAGSFFAGSLRADLGNAKSANELGVWLAHQNQLDQAKQLFVRAVKLSPLFQEAWFNLAKIHHRLGEDRLAEIAAQQGQYAKSQQNTEGTISFVSAEEFHQAGGMVETPGSNMVQPSVRQQSFQQPPQMTGRPSGPPPSRQQVENDPRRRPVDPYAPFGSKRGAARNNTQQSQGSWISRTWENRPRISSLLPSWSGKSQPKQSQGRDPSKFGGF